MRVKIMLVILALCVAASSCIKNYEEVQNEPYRGVYRLDDIQIQVSPYCIDIFPAVAEFDKDYDADSRAFYAGVDTVLSFSGKRGKITSSNRERDFWCALDWRISSIEVTALDDDYAKKYPGGSIKEHCQIWYRYKHSLIIEPLTEVQYGTLMLTDYYPYSAGTAELIRIYFFENTDDIPGRKEYPESKKFKYEQTESALPHLEVRITDAFGREFSATYDGSSDLE